MSKNINPIIIENNRLEGCRIFGLQMLIIFSILNSVLIYLLRSDFNYLLYDYNNYIIDKTYSFRPEHPRVHFPTTDYNPHNSR